MRNCSKKGPEKDVNTIVSRSKQLPETNFHLPEEGNLLFIACLTGYLQVLSQVAAREIGYEQRLSHSIHFLYETSFLVL